MVNRQVIRWRQSTCFEEAFKSKINSRKRCIRAHLNGEFNRLEFLTSCRDNDWCGKIPNINLAIALFNFIKSMYYSSTEQCFIRDEKFYILRVSAWISNDFEPVLISHVVDKGITCGNGTKDSVSGHFCFENWSDSVLRALIPLVKFNKSFFFGSSTFFVY